MVVAYVPTKTKNWTKEEQRNNRRYPRELRKYH